jgi:hypothetical protein
MPAPIENRLLSVEQQIFMTDRHPDPFQDLVHVARSFATNSGVYYIACRGRMDKKYFIEVSAVPTCVACIAANLRSEWP